MAHQGLRQPWNSWLAVCFADCALNLMHLVPSTLPGHLPHAAARRSAMPWACTRPQETRWVGRSSCRAREASHGHE